MRPNQEKPDYGFDAPGIMRGFFAAAFGAVLAGLLVRANAGGSAWQSYLGGAIAGLGLLPLVPGLMMLAYGLVGKHRTRDVIIGLVAWRGDEQVLDIGTGAGLLLIGAAERLTTGRAVGIDVWSAKDLSNNGPEAAARNVVLEGVGNRVRIETGDAQKLDFPDASFDVVLSLLCLHNIEGAAGQRAACAEIARVLKPGGRVIIGDYVPTYAYGVAFEAAGLRLTPSRTGFSTALSPLWIVEAEKPE